MEQSNNITYFDTVKVGDLELKNRIVHAAMVRLRCDNALHGVPNNLMFQYHVERADFGMIITGCSAISQRGNAYPRSAGIYTNEQVLGWKKVVEAVHSKGGIIVLQIWHAGRVAQMENNGGLEPWAPSAIRIPGKSGIFGTEFNVPHEVSKEEIKELIQQFRKGAENAKEAGFDGIELHGAHGYILDEFIRDKSNQRTDQYGGSIQNRCRLILECIDQLIEVFGSGRVGVKLSPVNRDNDMFDSNPLETFGYLVKELNQRKVAFIEFREPEPVDEKNINGDGSKQISNVCKAFRPIFNGVIIANESFTFDTGLEKLKSGDADLISFGTLTINNPDLVNRFRNKWPVNTNYDYSTWLSPGAKGYIGFLTYEEEQMSIKENKTN